MSSADRDTPAPALLLGIAALTVRTAHAAEAKPLDEEFLDYLSQLEGDEEDWTLFADDKQPQPAKPVAVKPPPNKQPVSKASPATAPKVAAEGKR